MIQVIVGGAELLPAYAQIPITFEVDSIFRLEHIDAGLGGIRLIEELVVEPYIKDYDIYDCGPINLPNEFDLSKWCFILLKDGEEPVGGGIIAFDTPGVNMLAKRSDLAVLWDIRVHPDYRGQGLGSQIFAQAVKWAKERKCTQLKIETQNINVKACKFYQRQGCHLGEIDIYNYYPEIKDEVMLIWYFNL